MNTETLFESEFIEKLVEEHNLIVYNDDFNTFDHVIDSLMKICKHNLIQAEQCTLLIHYTGKCEVKTGDYKMLASMCAGLHDCGITAEVK